MTDLQSIPLRKIRLSYTESQKARRERLTPESLAELSESIATHGVLQPIIVRRIVRSKVLNYLPDDPEFQLVAGERRLAASGQAGLETIPCVVRELTDEQVLEVQLIENLQREDLHPMHEAEGYHQLMTLHQHAAEDLAARVGKSRSYVYGRLKLLDLAPPLRKAFYAGHVSPSVALLLARIPGEKLQLQALKDLADPNHPVPYRRAQEIVRDRYMLQLSTASFPTGETLNGVANCGGCPKRTGNQAELFGDVKSPDVCTDPECFRGKSRAHGQRLLDQAKKSGQPVITGKKAKEVAPWGIERLHLRGYVALDAQNWSDGRSRTNRKILGPDVTPTLLQDPETGRVIEVVPEALVNKALKESRGAAGATDDGSAARRKKALEEKKFREALYAELRPKLEPPTRRQMAIAIFERLPHDTVKVLAKIRGWEPPAQARQYGGDYKNWGAIGKELEVLPDDEVSQFVNDMLYASELMTSTWSDAKPEKLLAAAKVHQVDVKAIRAALKPKPKAKKKAPAKTRGQKRNEKMAANRKAAKASTNA